MAAWLRGVGNLEGGIFSSTATAISANGLVVVGSSRSWCAGAASSLGCYWSDGVLDSINPLLGRTGGSGALAISADGSVVVGSSASSNGIAEAFRWQNGVMVGLGDLAGGAFASSALAVSADGSVVAGASKTGLGDEAFYWRADTGMQRLKDILDNASVDTEGGILLGAQGISADGLTIVGEGIDPLGREQGWIAFVAEPDEFAAGAVSALAMIGLGWRDRRRAARTRRAPDSAAIVRVHRRHRSSRQQMPSSARRAIVPTSA